MRKRCGRRKGSKATAACDRMVQSGQLAGTIAAAVAVLVLVAIGAARWRSVTAEEAWLSTPLGQAIMLRDREEIVEGIPFQEVANLDVTTRVNLFAAFHTCRKVCLMQKVLHFFDDNGLEQDICEKLGGAGRERDINSCKSLREEWETGLCLSSYISRGSDGQYWACDIAHCPRLPIDENKTNQCHQGHWIELDTTCEFLRYRNGLDQRRIGVKCEADGSARIIKE